MASANIFFPGDKLLVHDFKQLVQFGPFRTYGKCLYCSRVVYMLYFMTNYCYLQYFSLNCFLWYIAGHYLHRRAVTCYSLYYYVVVNQLLCYMMINFVKLEDVIVRPIQNDEMANESLLLHLQDILLSFYNIYALCGSLSLDSLSPFLCKFSH